MMLNRQIVVRLIGGLGNQLFQIQYAMSLQEKIGGIIQIDDSFLAESSKSHEKLAFTALNYPFEIIRLGWFDLKVKRVIERIFYKFRLSVPKIFHPIYFFENTEIDYEGISRIIIDGFWQDASHLRESFIKSVRKKIANNSLLENRQMDNLICVHIRRGDYLTNKHWGVKQQIPASLDYYLQAFDFFEKALSNPLFEIYTDDEIWALEKFGTKANVRVVQSKKLPPLQLLSTMANYENYVIANSSLSWWAAVLSKNNQKKVVMPNRWSIKHDSKKFQLPGWVILPG